MTGIEIISLVKILEIVKVERLV